MKSENREKEQPRLTDVVKFAYATLALAIDADAPEPIIDNLLDALRWLEQEVTSA